MYDNICILCQVEKAILHSSIKSYILYLIILEDWHKFKYCTISTTSTVSTTAASSDIIWMTNYHPNFISELVKAVESEKE